MSKALRTHGNIISFARRWHVILEIDLVAMVADHGARRTACDRLEARARALSDRPSPAAIEAIRCDLILCAGAEGHSHLEALFAQGHESAVIAEQATERGVAIRRQARALAGMLDRRPGAGMRIGCQALTWLLCGFAQNCRAAMDCEELAVLALGGKRLAPQARTLLARGLAARADAEAGFTDSPREGAIHA